MGIRARSIFDNLLFDSKFKQLDTKLSCFFTSHVYRELRLKFHSSVFSSPSNTQHIMSAQIQCLLFVHFYQPKKSSASKQQRPQNRFSTSNPLFTLFITVLYIF